MWNLTSFDVNRIKGQLQARRARIDAKYAEETKALDAEFAELGTLERVAAEIALKYKPNEAADAPERSPDDAAQDNPQNEVAIAQETPAGLTVGDGNGVEVKLGSRWRLALRDRPAVSVSGQESEKLCFLGNISISCRRPREPACQQLNRSQIKPRFAAGNGRFEILRQPPIAAKPAEGPLDHPAPWQYLKTFGLV